MPYKNTLEAINLQLHEIQKNIAYWEVQETIYEIDVDLALNKMRDVYDLLIHLKNELPVLQEKEEEVIELQPEPTKDPEIEIVQEKAVNVPDRQIETDIPEEISEKEPTLMEGKEKETAEAEDKQSSLSEKYANTRPTLNEELSTQVDSEDLAKHLKTRPITNLSAAIGLNEKFELINHLFHGNKENYESTIENLNMASNFNEAYNYLSSKLNWDMSDPLVQRLLDLIRRKLITK